MSKSKDSFDPTSMYFYDENGNIQYTDEANQKFRNVTKDDYERIKNKLNRVEIIGERNKSISLNERKGIWLYLYKELLSHIDTLQKLYPYCDFTSARKRAKEVVFRIRFEADKNIDVVDDQMTSPKYPFIALHTELKGQNKETDIKGYTGIRHEFTHFCCDGLNLPRFLNEGITQEITTDCLIKENYDKEYINYSLSTYKVNAELAQVYMGLFAKENIVYAYFKQDASSIRQMIIELASQIPMFSDIANEEFVRKLDYEINLLLIYAQSYVDFSDKRYKEFADFKCFIRFLQFAAYIYSKEPNFAISESYKQKINNIYTTFSSFFEQRSTDENAILR